jgi:DNA repair protein RadC
MKNSSAHHAQDPKQQFEAAVIDNIDATARENLVIERALLIVNKRFKQHLYPCLETICELDNYCKLTFANLSYEQFGCLYFNSRGVFLGFEILAKGTLGECPIYPRQVIAQALAKNATAMIFIHNHPQDTPAPSTEDINTTNILSDLLSKVGIQLWDHRIVGASGQVCSMLNDGYFIRHKNK